MTKVAAISVQPASRPATARPAAPAAAAKPVVATPAAPAAPSLPPQASPVAVAVLGVLIDLQAKVRPVDPEPTHGHDDDHGHRPPEPPPVVQPPVPPPPVVQPPVVQPPQPAPRSDLGADPAAAGRTIAMVDRFRGDVRIAEQARSAFEAQAAQRQAFASVIEDHSAVALLQVLQAGMASFDASFSASKLRRGFYA